MRKAIFMKMKMHITFKFIPFIALLVVFLTTCKQKSGYERLLESELASGERYDSLFLGLYLRMSSEEFYKHCWELNRQGLVRQGSRNTTVAYHLGDQLPHSAMMDFYPQFLTDRIVEMPVIFRYDAWSPWNRNLWADSLQQDVVKLLETWHGNGFVKVEHPEKGVAYVKIDGNRRIVVATLDDQHVKVLYTDMSVNLPETRVAPASK